MAKLPTYSIKLKRWNKKQRNSGQNSMMIPRKEYEITLSCICKSFNWQRKYSPFTFSIYASDWFVAWEMQWL